MGKVGKTRRPYINVVVVLQLVWIEMRGVPREFNETARGDMKSGESMAAVGEADCGQSQLKACSICNPRRLFWLADIAGGATIHT